MENNKLNEIKSAFITNKKNLIIGLALIVALFLIAFALSKRAGQTEMLAEGCNPGDTFSQTTGKPCKETQLESCLEGELYDKNTGEPCEKKTSDASKNEKGDLSYESALKEYATRSIAFDASCAPTPAELKVSLGSSMLISNNSTELLKINILGNTTNLRPYHYMLTTIKTAEETPISCNDKVSSRVSTM